MTSASSSLESQQGNGRIKLKIKFSRSKGFISDIVDVSDPNLHDDGLSCPTPNEPAPSTEPPSSPQQTQVSSSASTSLASISKLVALRNPAFVPQLLSDGSEPDCVDLKESPGIVHEAASRDHVSEHSGGVTESVPSVSDLSGCSSPEKNGQQPSSCQEETENQLCANSNPKFTDLPGVNYGKVLQDLEFLSSQQDEVERRYDSLHVQNEQHIIQTSSAVDALKPSQTVIVPDAEEKADMDNSDIATAENISDKEPMSPFDINCNLGLEDEEFSFTESSWDPLTMQKKREQMKENPIFPWSVENLTHSGQHCADLLPRSNTQTVHDGGGTSALDSAVKHTYFGSRDQLVTSVGKILDRAVSEEFQQDTESKTVKENNRNIFQLTNNFGSRPIDVTGTGPMLRSRSATYTNVQYVQDGCANLPCLSVTENTQTKTTSAESESHHSIINRRVSDSQSRELSVRNTFSGVKSGIRHNSLPVLCQRPPRDSGTVKRSDSQGLAPAALHLPVPQNTNDGQNTTEKNQLLIKLLTSAPKLSNSLNPQLSVNEEGSLPRTAENRKQLADNLPVVEPFPTPLNCATALGPDKSTEGNQTNPATSFPLSRTIDELRKRVGDQVLPEDSSDISQEKATPRQAHSSTSHMSSSKKAEGSKSAKWCKCKEPDFEVVNSTSADGSEGKVCKKCHKRQKRKRKKNVDSVWCRCDTPNPYTPEGMVSMMCTTCLKRVSKQWKKRAAAQWCKCLTPVMCTVQVASDQQQENASDKINLCRRCYKRISKDKEDVCMRGDQFGQVSGASLPQAECLQPLMNDHNYSLSPFSPEVLNKRPASEVAASVQLPTQKEQPGVLQGSSSQCILLQGGSEALPCIKKIQLVYVYPRTSISTPGINSSVQPSGRSSAVHLLSLLKQQAEGVPVALHSAPATTTSTLGCALPPSDNAHQLSTFSVSSLPLEEDPLSEKTIIRKKRKGKVQSVTPVASAEVKKTLDEKFTTAILSSCPAWLQGIDRTLLQPCYVVMDTLRKESLCEHDSNKAAGLCSVLCRQNSLNVMCRQGHLKQCGLSLEHEHAVSEECADDMTVLKRKKCYFSHNKTMVGFEEIEKKLEQQKSQLAARDSTPSAGFIPLSSTSQDGISSFRITSQQGVQIQPMSETITRNPDLLPTADGTQGAEDSSLASSMSPGTSSKETTDKKNNKQKHKSKTTWLKRSKFSFKYYIYGAQKRAFIVPLPLLKQCGAKAAPQLDEEDMRYIRKAIDELAREKPSCARLLKYPESLQHKDSDRTVGENATKRAFVAPTLGGQDLDMEGLKSLISEGDFSRLVPRSSRISKSKYLQEIGEKVHMYLTGGSEEAPEWIKDVARSLVMKNRQSKSKTKSKTRLRPSKNVSIEIDYAHEQEESSESERGDVSPSQLSVRESDFSARTSSAALPQTETSDQINNSDSNSMSNEVNLPHPIGSYVVAEAFAQEEKKPLIQNMPEAIQGNNLLAVDGTVPEPGQQIMIPLPENCNCDQEWDNGMLTSVSSSTSVQPFTEPQVSEEKHDKKPLLGELLAAATVYTSHLSGDETQDDCTNSQSEQLHEQHSFNASQLCQTPEQQVPVWPLAHVKEEPPDEGYEHAWASHTQTEGIGQTHSAQYSTERPDTIPFITNSTFGNGAVNIEDDNASAATNLNQNQSIDTEMGVKAVVKMEPPDAESGEAVTTPLITCVASGELAAMFTGADQNETFKIFSAAQGELKTVGNESHHHGMISSTVKTSACTSGTAIHKHSADEQTHESDIDGFTLGELVCRSVDEQFSVKDTGDANVCEQTQIIIMPESATDVPQISAVSFGEAAKLWQTEDKDSGGCTAVPQQSDSSLTSVIHQSEFVSVIGCVLNGDKVEQEDSHVAHAQRELRLSTEQQMDSQEDYNEDYGEDFHDDDEYYEEESNQIDVKPAVVSEGQVLSIPLVLPGDANPSEVIVGQPLNVPQVGVDLSIVKQEPQDVEGSSLLFPNIAIPQCTVLLPGPQHVSMASAEEEPQEPAPVPAILEVRSLAALTLPPGYVSLPQDLQNVSSVTSLPVKSHDSLESFDSPPEMIGLSSCGYTDTNLDSSKMAETERERNSHNCEDKISENQELFSVKSVATKATTNRRKKTSSKTKQLQKHLVDNRLVDLKQQQSQKDSILYVESKVSSVNETESFIPPLSSSSNSLAVPGNTYITGQTEENVPATSGLASPNVTISSSHLPKSSDVAGHKPEPSEVKSASKDVSVEENTVLNTGVSSSEDFLPTDKSDCESNFESDNKNAIVDQLACLPLTSCSVSVQETSSICSDVTKESSAQRPTSAIEAVLSKKDSIPCVSESLSVDKSISSEHSLSHDSVTSEVNKKDEDVHIENKRFENNSGTSNPKPMVMGEGMVLAVPLSLPNENNSVETRKDQPLNVPQIGADFSIVKEEPQDVEDYSVMFPHDLVPQCTVLLPSPKQAVVKSTEEEPTPVPSLQELDSLSSLPVPSQREKHDVKSQEASQELEHCSLVVSLQMKPPDSLKSADPQPEINDPLSSESMDANCPVSKTFETEMEESRQPTEDVVPEGQQHEDSSIVRSVVNKAKPKRTKRKATGKKKRQPKRTVNVSLPELSQEQHCTDNSYHLENNISSATDVDPLAASMLSTPSSSAVKPVGLHGDQAVIVEHNGRNDPANSIAASPNLSLPAITSRRPVVTLSELKLSHEESHDQNCTVADNVVPRSHVPSSQNTLPTRRNGSSDDSAEARNSRDVVQRAILTRSLKLQRSSSHEMHVSTECSVQSLSPVPPKNDCNLHTNGSQSADKDETTNSCLTPYHNAENSSLTESNRGMQSFPDVSASNTQNDAVFSTADSVTKQLEKDRENSFSEGLDTQLNCHLNTGCSQISSASLGAQDNSRESKDNSPNLSDIPSTQSSNTQEDRNKNNAATPFTNSVNAVGENRASVVTCVSATLEAEDSETFSDSRNIKMIHTVKDGPGVRNLSKAKAGKHRRARSKSKTRKKVRPQSEGSLSATIVSDSCQNVNVSNPQDSTLASQNSPSGPLSKTVSLEENSSALTVQATRILRSSSKSLSENHVSSSCDVPITSQKSSVVDLDEHKEKSLSPDRKRRSVVKNKVSVQESEESDKLLKDRQDTAAANPAELGSPDEGVHYVSQIFEGRGKKGGTCLVLRKTRSAQSSPLQSAPSFDPSKSSVTDKESKEIPEPPTKLQKDVGGDSEPVLSKLESKLVSEPGDSKGLKRKADDLNVETKSNKAAKSERSIFSDITAVLSSFVTPSESASASSSKSCSQHASSDVATVAQEAALKVAEKGFNKNMFSRLRASLVSVKSTLPTSKGESVGCRSTDAETESSSPSENPRERERSFFDCLPQGLLEAWKNK